MSSGLRDFVDKTHEKHKGRMKGLRNLVFRRPSARDWVDSAAVGGVLLADVLADRITEADIDPQVLEAFHAQYPNAGDFVDKVQSLSDDPEALQGLVNGVKGKLFEAQFVDMLNEGLPPGYVAELAESPTQPGWDVAVRGPDDEIQELLQLKASSDADYIRESLERYPDFDIVVPSDAYTEMSLDSSLADHVFDAGIPSEDFVEPITIGIEDVVEDAGLDLFYPLAFAPLAVSAARRLAKGESKEQVARDSAGRAVRTAVASSAGGLASWALGGPWGIGIGIATRLLLAGRESRQKLSIELDRMKARVVEIEVIVEQRSRGRVRIVSPEALLAEAEVGSGNALMKR
jgi:hypothetical protein